MRYRREWAWGCWLALGVPLFLILILPPAVLAYRGSEFVSTLSSETAIQAMTLSLWTTALSLVLTVALGTPAAFYLARSKQWHARLLDAVCDLPIVLPPAVAGIALLLLFGREGVIGGFLDARGISIAFTAWAVVLAQCFVAAPLYLRAATVALRGIDQDIEHCAILDGASSFQTFGRITLPLARHGLVTGAVLSWARALGEFGATILFAGNLEGKTQTLPLAIYTGFESDLGSAEAMSCVLLAVAVVVLVVAKMVAQSRRTS